MQNWLDIEKECLEIIKKEPGFGYLILFRNHDWNFEKGFGKFKKSYWRLGENGREIIISQ